MKRISLAIFLLLSLLLVGCGTVDVNFHTTVKPSGDLIQEIKIEASGMLSDLVTGPGFAEDFRKDGWQVEIEKEADRTSLVATKNFERGVALIIPSFSVEGEDVSAPDKISLKFDIRDRILVREYFFEVTVPGGPTETTATEVEGEFAELEKTMQEALKAMFSMSWTITLPGQIIETNADTTEGSSATWYFDIDSLAQGRHMMIHTKYVNWPIVGGLIAIVVIAIASTGMFLLIRKRQAKKTVGGA